MEILNDSFTKALEEINEPSKAFIRILDAKLSNINISLTKKQKKRIEKQLDTGSLIFQITDRQISKSGLSEEYIKEYINELFNSFDETISEYEKSMTEIISKVTVEVSDDLSDQIFSRLKKTFKGIKKNREKIHNRFKKDAYIHWKESFDYMDMILFSTREIIESFKIAPNSEYPNRNLLLVKLVSKGCLIFSEIITLLKNGFPDGAYSRWRSLHEITVLAEFLSDKSDEAAIRFINHQHVQDYKHAKKIIEDINPLYQFEITETEYDLIKKNYEAVIEEYGRSFANDYGWASELFDKKRIYFSDIEQAVDFENIRSHYKMSSDTIHTNSRGLFFNMGLIDNQETDLLIGPSIIGLSIPISLSVTSMCLLNMNVLINVNNEVLMDDLVFLKIFNKYKECVVPKCFDEESIVYDKML